MKWHNLNKYTINISTMDRCLETGRSKKRNKCFGNMYTEVAVTDDTHPQFKNHIHIGGIWYIKRCTLYKLNKHKLLSIVYFKALPDLTKNTIRELLIGNTEVGIICKMKHNITCEEYPIFEGYYHIGNIWYINKNCTMYKLNKANNLSKISFKTEKKSNRTAIRDLLQDNSVVSDYCKLKYGVEIIKNFKNIIKKKDSYIRTLREQIEDELNKSNNLELSLEKCSKTIKRYREIDDNIIKEKDITISVLRQNIDTNLNNYSEDLFETRHNLEKANMYIYKIQRKQSNSYLSSYLPLIIDVIKMWSINTSTFKTLNGCKINSDRLMENIQTQPEKNTIIRAKQRVHQNYNISRFRNNTGFNTSETVDENIILKVCARLKIKKQEYSKHNEKSTNKQIQCSARRFFKEVEYLNQMEVLEVSNRIYGAVVCKYYDTDYIYIFGLLCMEDSGKTLEDHLFKNNNISWKKKELKCIINKIDIKINIIAKHLMHWLDIKNGNICINGEGELKFIDCGDFVQSFDNPNCKIRRLTRDTLKFEFKEDFKEEYIIKFVERYSRILMYIQYAFSTLTHDKIQNTNKNINYKQSRDYIKKYFRHKVSNILNSSGGNIILTLLHNEMTVEKINQKNFLWIIYFYLSKNKYGNKIEVKTECTDNIKYIQYLLTNPNIDLDINQITYE